MKFSHLILALALFSLVPTLPSCTYSQVLHRQENGMALLREALVQANNKSSADVAAIAVRRYGSLLHEDLNTLLDNGRPSFIQLAMLRKSYQNSAISAEAKGVLREFFRLYSQGFYGSTELRQAFLDMLKFNRNA